MFFKYKNFVINIIGASTYLVTRRTHAGHRGEGGGVNLNGSYTFDGDTAPFILAIWLWCFL